MLSELAERQGIAVPISRQVDLLKGEIIPKAAVYALMERDLRGETTS